ncbi:hypothetical protein [Legionella fallonii]|nr:hypothetical protein [Legionella fallonii]
MIAIPINELVSINGTASLTPELNIVLITACREMEWRLNNTLIKLQDKWPKKRKNNKHESTVLIMNPPIWWKTYIFVSLNDMSKIRLLVVISHNPIRCALS